MYKKMTLNQLYLSILILASLQSCTYNPLDVDASSIKVKTNFINLDSIFRSSDSSQLMNYHHKLQFEISEIYDYQLGYCLGLRTKSDTTFYNGIQQFLKDDYIKNVELEISKQFKNLLQQKENIIDGFRHLKFHLKDIKIPEHIVFMNSFFAANTFVTEKEIGIGLERYLGAKTQVIQQLPPDQFFEWMKAGLDKKYLERDALCAWIMTHCVDEAKGNLAEHIIQWGKILYLTKAAFPEKTDAEILRYTDEDFTWAINNEAQVWEYLVKDKILFKLNEQVIMNFIKEGPFTPGLPEEGPDRLGQFMGLRMIQKYMEIKKISVAEMTKLSYTEILSEYEIE
ncbi:MAG: hypothetical protein V4638_12105 [Bacteroidota bacterium]